MAREIQAAPASTAAPIRSRFRPIHRTPPPLVAARLTPGPGYTYGIETWWDDSKTSPPAGQGGFGTSKFFSAPSYQNGFGVTNRSVPDVVSNADPFHGVEVCQADDGGCPNGKQYGGTSMSAPEWAGYTALLNQSLGANLGFLNPVIYPLAGTDAFHNAASLTSDFAHVGLGSPNLEGLHQMLANETVGGVDASVSEVLAFLQNGFQPAGAPVPSGEPRRRNLEECEVTVICTTATAMQSAARPSR